MTSTEYAAGLFEGEGSVGTYPIYSPKSSRSCSTRACIKMTDLEPLQKFHEAVGGLGRIKGPYINKRIEHYKPHWEWRVTNMTEVAILKDLIYEHLSPRRQAQFDVAVTNKELYQAEAREASAIRATPNQNAKKTHCPQGHEYTPENTYQYAYGRSCKICVKDRTYAARERKST